jgi:hypothetical protein
MGRVDRLIDLAGAGARDICDHRFIDRRNALEAVRAVHAPAADPMPRIDFDAFDCRRHAVSPVDRIDLSLCRSFDVE